MAELSPAIVLFGQLRLEGEHRGAELEANMDAASKS
jgi:hypothetical protein